MYQIVLLCTLKESKSVSHSVMSDSLQPYGLYSPLGSSALKFSRQDYWSVLPCPSVEDLPDPGIECRSPALQADSLLTEPPGKPIVHLKLI